MRSILLAALVATACNCRLPAEAETPEQDLNALAARIGQIVHIDACFRAVGSGVNLGNGHALTAFHVLAGCSTYVVTNAITDRVEVGELDTANRFDLARIKLSAPIPGPAVHVASTKPGDIVCGMVAFPDLMVRCGHVLQVSDERGGIVHTVPVQKGNSGGGLYDTAGNLVGIIVTCNLTAGKCDGSGGGATAVAPHAWMVE
jgi:S1-C subfamily serine protease